MWSKVRKFGLGYSDLPTMLWNVSVLLWVLTLNIDKRNRRRIPLIFYILTAVATACFFYVYLVSMVWFVWRCTNTGDVLAALIFFSLGVSSEIGTMKLFYMFLYIDKVQQIVSECLASDAQVVPNSRFSKNLLKTMQVVKKRAMLFWIVIISNGVVYIMKPILMPGRNLMEDQFNVYGLEPTYESPNYEITFLLMAVSVCVTCYEVANITVLMVVITGYTEAQMLSWSEELLHLWEDAENHHSIQQNEASTSIIDSQSRNKELNDYVKFRLKAVIKGHSTNINLVRQIEDIFRGAIAIEFSLLIIGLIAELLGGLENTYLQLPFALMPVAMDCLTGQRIMDASLVFERAVYDCKWENFDKNNMKTVLLMLQNSQKTMTLSAGGITKLSFVSLMAVIKSVYSAYTTLRTTMK